MTHDDDATRDVLNGRTASERRVLHDVAADQGWEYVEANAELIIVQARKLGKC